MNLLDLPEELLIKIIRSLDTKSLFNMHNTCSYLRHIIGMPGVIKVCKLSLSSMASAHNLTFQFVKNVEGHLQELDMKCVPNLEMALLLNTLMRMKALKVLDVSYTKINIMDLIEIHLICPTINDIGINFDFGITPWIKVPPEVLEECKTMFENFKNVHFVGNFESLYCSNLPVLLLQKAKLNKLQLTVTSCNLPPYESSEKVESMGEFNQIVAYFLHWTPHQVNPDINEFYLASMLDITKCECLCIVWLTPMERVVSSTPLLHDFFKERFELTPFRLINTTLRVPIRGNVIYMVWNKKSTVFDAEFYNSLFRRLQPYFPHYHMSLKDTRVMPKWTDWLHISQYSKTDLCDHVLDLDPVTAEKETIKLTVSTPNNPETCISLPADKKYLHKITYLCLNSVLCYGSNFFNLIFTSCVKLQTFNFAFAHYSSAVLTYLTEALPMSKSLENFRIVSPYLEMQSMLTSMSKCKTLQNIQIVDLCNSPQPLSLSRAIFEKCENLYSYIITMEIPPDARARKLRLLNRLKFEYKRYHLYIEIHSPRFSQYSYDPFIGVFDLFPVKPV